MSTGFSATGIVLKRIDTGEADRIITLFTKEHGKVTSIAKGCRKLTSSKLSALEPGTLSKLHFVETKSMPILTQAVVINSYAGSRADLSSIRKLFEILEIIDSLLFEGDEQPEVFSSFEAILQTLHAKDAHTTARIRTQLAGMLECLGYGSQEEIDLTRPVRDLIEELTQRKMKAYAFLGTAN